MSRPKMLAVPLDKGELPPTVRAEVDRETVPPYGMVAVTWLAGPVVVMQPAIARLLGGHLIAVADQAETEGGRF